LSRATTRIVLLALAAVAWLCSVVPLDADASEESAARELAEKYVPVMKIREQEDPLCGTKGEQYQVMNVDALFDNPAVVLRRTEDESVVKRAPRMEDVAGRGEEIYIDLPGDPLGETCVYAKDFDRMKREGEAPVVVYAHIAREKGRPGLALQYWFYWYFNQFNDLHESDWEGMQLTFAADTPEEALGQEPEDVLLFQHGGAERAKWDDTKVEKEGDHPVVYPAAGSHATFYMSAVFPQNGSKGSGVGCDNTTAPLRDLRPRPVLMPDEPTDRGQFAWTSFDGRWGQKEKSFNNGPTGPQTKPQWEQPFTWMEQQRWSAPRMPGGGIMGPEAVNAFCGVIEDVTSLMNLQQADPLAAYVTIAVFLALVVLVFGVSKWRPADASRLRERREYGQIVATALKLYARHWRTFVVLAAFAIPVVGGTQLLGGWLIDSAGGNGLKQALGDIVNGLGRPVAGAISAALVVVYLRELMAGRKPGFRSAVTGTRERFWRVVGAEILATVGIVLMFVTIVGIPFAIWKLVGWNFVQQEVLFTDKSFRQAFRGSTELVRGKWWHALRTILPLALIGIIVGPFLGLILIFTSLPLLLVNLIGSLVYALAIPFTATGATLLYLDLQVRGEEDPAPARRSWSLRHPSRFGRREQPAT
jgi:hypothetical protein